MPPPGAVATVKTVPAPVPAPATAAEAKLRLWEGDDEDDTLKKDTAPQTPEAAAQMAELKRKIEGQPRVHIGGPACSGGSSGCGVRDAVPANKMLRIPDRLLPLV